MNRFVKNIMSHLAQSLLQRLPSHDLCNRSLKAIQRWKRHELDEMEVILDGWLIKLSSDHRLFRKKRWNKYWFVLCHSAHNAGKVILEYYKDSNCHNLRGRIDLSECEQLDSGLQFGKKETIDNGFDIRTGSKIYYLVAETEVEMNKWVGCISTVCGLKLKSGDDCTATTVSTNGTETLTPSIVALYSKDEEGGINSTQTPSPYIHISECFTGKPIPGWPNVDDLNCSSPKDTDFNFPFTISNYDYPKPTYSQEKKDTSLESDSVDELYKIPPPPRIYKTDYNNKVYAYVETPSRGDNQEALPFEGVNLGNNIFLYNSGPAIYHENSDQEIVRKEALQLAQQLECMGLGSSGEEANDLLHYPSSECINEATVKSKSIEFSADLLIPPPRPPKPQDLHKEKLPHTVPLTKQNNVSSFSLTSGAACLETNDFHLATQTLDSSTDNNFSQQDFKTFAVFLDDLYDVPKPRSEDNLTLLLRASNFHSKENFHTYDNAPPAFVKSSPQDCEMPLNFCCEAEMPLQCLAEQSMENNSKYADRDKCCDIPPIVNRNLKPKKTITEKNDEKPSQVMEKPSNMENYKADIFCNQNKRDIDLDSTVERPLLYAMNEVQYLDLNLDDTASDSTSKLEESQAKRTTIYKTVDFLRTEAFNKTRQNVEEVYRSSS